MTPEEFIKRYNAISEDMNGEAEYFPYTGNADSPIAIYQNDYYLSSYVVKTKKWEFKVPSDVDGYFDRVELGPQQLRLMADLASTMPKQDGLK